MRLSQALNQRSDIKKRIDQLGKRLIRSSRIFEGEQVPENPEKLLEELDELTSQLTLLIAQINKTNSITAYDESKSLTDALAERD
ncbi:MAG: DIP1984 family protein, partial [Chloroflexota bacterium]